MKFKIDENIPLSMKDVINEYDTSFGVHSVYDENLQGKSDKMLIETCNSEQRVLITLDNDFLDYVMYPQNEIFGVILLKSKTQGKKAVKRLFLNFLMNIDLTEVKNNVVIVDETSIRIRDQID